MTDSRAGAAERIDPVDREYRRRRWRWRLGLVAVLLVVAAVVYWTVLAPIPVDYADDAEHFKYGSIGSDFDGIPLQVWKVLPQIFAEHLPQQGAGYLRVPTERRTYLDGYAQFGFLIEADKPLPIGFSQRRVLVDRVGLNCAVCHTSTIAVSEGMAPERLYGMPPTYIARRNPTDHRHTGRSVLVMGMPANLLDLEAYFAFLFRCAEDRRFTADNVLGAIDDQAKASGERIGIVERLILKQSIPRIRETLLTRRHQLHYISLLPHAAGDDEVIPAFGPGRVDTFSPYKSIQFGFPFDGTYGIADYPSIWNQRPREGMHLHWDGNNDSVFERNISASLGAGVTPVTLDMHRMQRVGDWIGAPPPPHPDFGGSSAPPSPRQVAAYRADPVPHAGEMQLPQYPFPIDATKAEKGRLLFASQCARCHDWHGDGVGKVVPIGIIGTDAARLDSYTDQLRANQNLLGAGYWWRFKNFRKTGGYANAPLDGIWARAPYLHNGSVPTLYDLLNPPCQTDDLEQLGITAETDFQQLAADPNAVVAIIQNARAARLRPPVFYRGDDRYDDQLGGFRCDAAESADGTKLFFYSTVEVRDGQLQTLLGNGHQGHAGDGFGTNFSDDEKAALVEYQKLIGQQR